MLPATLQFLIVMIACSINERMQKRLDYKTEEVLVLKEILRSVTGKASIDFTENHRKRLATKGKELTPKERDECCELVRPRTILEWFRRIYAEKYSSSKSRRRPGRPRKPEETRRLVLAIANDNLSWGYTKIRDAVNAGLGIDICRSTVANVLNEAGIVPAPERDKQRTWKQFMSSHWESLYACDFFAVEAPGVFGAVRHMVFFGQRHLRYVISEYMEHYHHERFHQGIGSSLIRPIAANDNSGNGPVRRRSRLGGLLNFYYRQSA